MRDEEWEIVRGSPELVGDKAQARIRLEIANDVAREERRSRARLFRSLRSTMSAIRVRETGDLLRAFQGAKRDRQTLFDRLQRLRIELQHGVDSRRRFRQNDVGSQVSQLFMQPGECRDRFFVLLDAILKFGHA